MPMQLIDRRRFLQLGIAAGAGVAATSVAGVGGVAAGGAAPGTAGAGGGTPAAPAPVNQRQLVVIDMAGGNDGLSMVPADRQCHLPHAPTPDGPGRFGDPAPDGFGGAAPVPRQAAHPRAGRDPGRRAHQARPVALRVAATLVGGRPQQHDDHHDRLSGSPVRRDRRPERARRRGIPGLWARARPSSARTSPPCPWSRTRTAASRASGTWRWTRPGPLAGARCAN